MLILIYKVSLDIESQFLAFANAKRNRKNE